MSGPKLTKALTWLRNYRNGCQNGRPYPVNAVYTRFKGTTHKGLKEAQALGLVTSKPDTKIHHHGWRHDITPAGRAALNASKGE